MPEPVIPALNGEWALEGPEASVSDGWIDALEVAAAPEVHDGLEVHDAPELVAILSFSYKKEDKKASETSNSLILAEIFTRLKENQSNP